MEAQKLKTVFSNSSKPFRKRTEVARTPLYQGEGRGFESLHPLHFFLHLPTFIREQPKIRLPFLFHIARNIKQSDFRLSKPNLRGLRDFF